jgi:hypothetical protein
MSALHCICVGRCWVRPRPHEEWPARRARVLLLLLLRRRRQASPERVVARNVRGCCCSVSLAACPVRPSARPSCRVKKQRAARCGAGVCTDTRKGNFLSDARMILNVTFWSADAAGVDLCQEKQTNSSKPEKGQVSGGGRTQGCPTPARAPHRCVLSVPLTCLRLLFAAED